MEKIALVIGGTGGIGSEIVRTFIKNGMKVCATYNKNKDMAEKMVYESKEDNLSVYQMDLTNEISVTEALKKITQKHNRIDVVVFSATHQTKNKQLLSMEWEDFQRHIDAQSRGLFYVTKNLINQIKEKRRTKFIVILTEYCFGKPPAGLSDYVTAKYSLIGLAKSMAAELAQYGCTVNMVSPGMTETNLIAGLPPKLIEITAQSNPLKRIAKPRDVANAVLFLASDGSDYINGVNIMVNGGGIML